MYVRIQYVAWHHNRLPLHLLSLPNLMEPVLGFLSDTSRTTPFTITRRTGWIIYFHRLLQSSTLFCLDTSTWCPPPTYKMATTARACLGAACKNTEVTLKCPTCLKLGKESYFCSQDCFRNNWVCHSILLITVSKECPTLPTFRCPASILRHTPWLPI